MRIPWAKHEKIELNYKRGQQAKLPQETQPIKWANHNANQIEASGKGGKVQVRTATGLAFCGLWLAENVHWPIITRLMVALVYVILYKGLNLTSA